MTIAILLSGAIGALLATVVSSLVTTGREQIALRHHVALEVSEWLEEARALRNQYFTARTALEQSMTKARASELTLTWEDRFNTIGDRLVVLVQSKGCVVKVALAYGEGKVSECAEQLQETIATLVLEEMKTIESGGLKALKNDRIVELRSAVDSMQEPLLKLLVRHGSLPEVVRSMTTGRPFDHGHRRSLPAARGWKGTPPGGTASK